jgi:hypothetical protein
MRVICFLFGHKWSKWKYIRAIGRYDEKLQRTCCRCHENDFYTGLTDYDSKGNKIPIK